MSKTQRVLDYVRQHPDARNKDVAEACGVSHAYASTIRQRLGYAPSRADAVPLIDIRGPLYKQQQTLQWLKATCPRDVELGVHIVSILTDAMLEDRDG